MFKKGKQPFTLICLLYFCIISHLDNNTGIANRVYGILYMP